MKKGLEEKDNAVAENEALKEVLAEKDARLADLMLSDPPSERPALSKKEEALVTAGCKVYGIEKKYVLSARVTELNGKETAVIGTHGGAKVFYNRDMESKKIDPLPPVRIDGLLRKKKVKKITPGPK